MTIIESLMNEGKTNLTTTDLDLFAMAALIGMMQADDYQDHQWAAQQAYKYANAMMLQKEIEEMGQ
jgi:hypothetical protein